MCQNKNNFHIINYGALRNILRATAIMFIFTVTFSGCEKLTESPGMNLIGVVDTRQDCGCAGTHHKLINRSHNRFRVEVDEVMTGGISNTQTLIREIGPQDSVPLGCNRIKSLNVSPGGTCDTNRNWHVVSTKKLTSLNINKFRLVKASATISDISPIESLVRTDPSTCWHDCTTDRFSDENTGACILIDQGVAVNSRLKGVRWLADKIQSSSSITLKKSSIMRNFEIDADPCDRSDTRIRDNVIMNTGNKCVLSGEMEIAGPPATVIEIHMPQDIKGQLHHTENGFEAIFENPEKSLRVKFQKDMFDYENDYGGLIKHIKETNTHLVFTTSRGCIGLK